MLTHSSSWLLWRRSPSTSARKTSKTVSTAKKETKTTQTKKSSPKTASKKRKVVENEIVEPNDDLLDLTADFNDLLSFDVELFRALFMELRKIVDGLYSKRERSEKDLAAYDEAIYNITANTIHESAAQDFLSFCYKKGFYDFCIMNYDKYMKWSILSASNGNAFTLSKLQIFLTTAIDKLYGIDNLDVLVDFLDLSEENFTLFLSKMLCREMVEILEISPEVLIKMPEKFVEQNEELSKFYDKTKMQACDQVAVKLVSAINQLLDNLKKVEAQKNSSTPQPEFTTASLPKEEPVEQVVESYQEKPVRFDKKSTIKKKFRY